MKYLKTIWKHKDSEYPIELYDEIDDNNYSIRTIHIYADGRVFYASEFLEFGTELSYDEIPNVDEINKDEYDDGLFAEYISKEIFEELWNKFVNQ